MKIVTLNPVTGDAAVEAALLEIIGEQPARETATPLAGPNDLIQISGGVEEWKAVLYGALGTGAAVVLQHELVQAWEWLKAQARKHLTAQGIKLLEAMETRDDADDVSVTLQITGPVPGQVRGVAIPVRGNTPEEKLLKIYLMARYGDQLAAKARIALGHPNGLRLNADGSIMVLVDEETGRPYLTTYSTAEKIEII